MNYVMTRYKSGLYGIFSKMIAEDNSSSFAILEHAYFDGVSQYLPKVAAGSYPCVRHPPNRLPYETFMLQNVPPFQGNQVTGCLIHIANYNNDLDGCLGIGKCAQNTMIEDSRIAYEEFMEIQKPVDSFILVIK